MINDIHYDSDLESKRWVGYFDLLGTKHLYKTRNLVSIFVALSSAIEKLKERTTAWENVGYAWFSDTFLVYTDDDSADSFGAMDNISRWFVYFLITDDIPVRGAISCGMLYADRKNNLFFGEASIEAYEYGEAQDWIGLLLCPSAERRLKDYKLKTETLLNYVYTDVPYNKRANNLIQNLLVCIVGNCVSVNDQNPIIKRMSEMKERVVDERIRSKYDRTIKFLNNNKRFLASYVDC